MKTLLSLMIVGSMASTPTLQGIHASDVTSQASPSIGQCSVQIESPGEGATVAGEVIVTGNAKVPADSHLWLLARREDFEPMWWPQRPLRLGSGSYQGRATLGGSQDSGHPFDIAVIAVDAEQHRELENYRTEAMKTGDWRPIKIAPPLCGKERQVLRR